MWKGEACRCSKLVLACARIFSNLQCTTDVNVGPVMVGSASHIQVFAARVLVLNDIFATGIKLHVMLVMMFWLVMVGTAVDRSDEPLR